MLFVKNTILSFLRGILVARRQQVLAGEAIATEHSLRPNRSELSERLFKKFNVFAPIQVRAVFRTT